MYAQEETSDESYNSLQISFQLWNQPLDVGAPYTRLCILQHFLKKKKKKKENDPGWCVTDDPKINRALVTQGGFVEIYNETDGPKSLNQRRSGHEREFLFQMSIDPAQCNGNGDPCDSKTNRPDTCKNNVTSAARSVAEVPGDTGWSG